MNILFLIFHGFYAHNGISKKITYQIEALKQCGQEVSTCYYHVDETGRRQWKVDNRIITDFGKGFKAKLWKTVYFGVITDYIRKNHIDVLYYRSLHNANPFTIHFLRQVKKTGAKVILEIPTYPYDGEYHGLKGSAVLLIDKLFRNRLCKYVDKIVTFSNETTIFNRPTICISNGIDFSCLPVRAEMHDTTHELHLIAVAEIHFWHGFDRIIQGLANYYKEPKDYKVYLHLVGEMVGDTERTSILSPIQENNLEPYVKLYGNQYGEGLERIFDKADFAIGSLGRHRSGVYNMKSLKNREYAARGFGFIYSETDDDFEQMPYILKAPADESPIDIESIISFVKSTDLSPTAIRNSVLHLSWEEQMKKVVASI